MMKHALLTTIFLFSLSLIFGQENKETTLLETKGKSQLYYVELSAAGGGVYEMGRHLDKAGSGYSFRSIDTLTRQQDQAGVTHYGKRTKIRNENGKLYLEIQDKKTEKYTLNSASNAAAINTNLNNAYFLDNFIALTEELNKSYTLNHISFREGFARWESLDNKEIPHAEFKTYADGKLRELKDSIIKVQDQFVSLRNSLVQDLKTIDYDALKAGLEKLPSGPTSGSKYFSNVINEVAKEKPEYFFRLAEDYPDKRKIIFYAVETNKQVMAGLKSVENHKDIKREFFRARGSDKHMPLRIIGTSVVAVAILVLLL